jgi:hypothetical protein
MILIDFKSFLNRLKSDFLLYFFTWDLEWHLYTYISFTKWISARRNSTIKVVIYQNIAKILLSQ